MTHALICLLLKLLSRAAVDSFLSEDFIIDLITSSIFMLVETHQSQALYQGPPGKLRSSASCHSHWVTVMPSNNAGYLVK